MCLFVSKEYRIPSNFMDAKLYYIYAVSILSLSLSLYIYIYIYIYIYKLALMVQMVKNLPRMQETQV